MASGALRYDDPRGEGPRRLTRPPDAIYGSREGLSGNDAYALVEDARGDLWISSNVGRPGASAVSRWSRATGKIESFPASAVGTAGLASSFLATRDGGLWIHFMDGRIVRVREGRFQ